MDLKPNPYKPGAGRVPPALTGRSQLIEEFKKLLYQAREEGEGQRPWILSGLRGVGKTVLLNQFGREALDLELVVVKAEASPGRSLSSTLAKELNLVLRKILSTSEKARQIWARAGRVLRSFQVRVDPSGVYSLGMDFEPEHGVADSGDLSTDLQELLESIGMSAREAGTVLLIAVDELQEATIDELQALNIALHSLGQNPYPVPVVFIGAGLPSLPGVLADATSYAERLYDYRQIGLLDAAATIDALTLPAANRGVTWSLDAITASVEATGGYPYFIQELGSNVWDVRTSDTITIDDTKIGADLTRKMVEQGLYKSRWERATPTQREYMRIMAEDGDGPTQTNDLVVKLKKKKQSDLSVLRGELIKSGLIYAPERGAVAFTVPGMAKYVQRQEH